MFAAISLCVIAVFVMVFQFVLFISMYRKYEKNKEMLTESLNCIKDINELVRNPYIVKRDYLKMCITTRLNEFEYYLDKDKNEN